MKTIAAVATTVAILTSGCANHVKQEVTTVPRIDREPVSRTISITPLQGTISPQGTVESPTVMLKLEDVSQERVAQKTTTRIADYVTPYQPARELYELPVGIVSIAGGVVVNVLDFALLGLLPNSFTDTPLAVGFAGINPFLNIESKSRLTETVVSENTELMDEKVEVTTLPLAGQRVSFVSNDRHLIVETGPDGVATAFIGPLMVSATPTVEMSLEGQSEAVRNYYVPRQLRQSVVEAVAIYDKHRTGDQSAEILESFEDDMIKLEAAGYHTFVREIETSRNLATSSSPDL